ncbi:MAG: hypothetical protein A2Y23_08075 [Clostridiales bacterium GWB2_37_7]|nr:MAG: hypothetical protein A2Y23_08075 [Clostridiales bacterium GWB2_37_7]
MFIKIKSLRSTWKKAIIIFLIIQISPLLVLWISPIRPIVDNSAEYFLGYLLYLSSVVVGFVITFGLLYDRLKNRVNENIVNKSFNRAKLKFNSNIIFGFSTLGLLLMIYDRVFVRGIDYSLGLRNARYQWLYSEISSSIWSKIGNLLIPFGYIGLWFLLVHKNNLSNKQKIQLSIAAFSTIIGHAAINGGRSQVLLGGVLWLSIKIVLIFKHNFNLERSKKIIRKYLPISIGIGFVTILTIEGISESMGIKEYVTDFAPTLLGTVESELMDMWDYFGNVGYVFIFFVMYLFHGQFSFRYLLSISEKSGSAFWGTLLNPIIEIFKYLNLPINSIPKDYFTTQYAMFLSLPGSFYYDGGFVGIILYSLLLGMLYAFVVVKIKFANCVTGYTLAFIFFVLFYIILAPIMTATGFAYFYFIIYSFVALEVINRIRFRKKTNWLI